MNFHNRTKENKTKFSILFINLNLIFPLLLRRRLKAEMNQFIYFDYISFVCKFIIEFWCIFFKLLFFCILFFVFLEISNQCINCNLNHFLLPKAALFISQYLPICIYWYIYLFMYIIFRSFISDIFVHVGTANFCFSLLYSILW